MIVGKFWCITFSFLKYKFLAEVSSLWAKAIGTLFKGSSSALSIEESVEAFPQLGQG
ncbi:hypothetical protein SAY86_001780 [Trapa natans]|uniref:Uncharacterized protein n=1 Tax=Trapa natans TaxID=22666 RepID=A0AAN7LQM7_TRANT|nr:hypothetical protein SAY86_001780 [Trapa natans]